jgi:adenylosuccinate lyase
MTATALDSAIFRDIFSTPEMRRVFSDETRTAYYLEIEAALARVQGRLGIVPQQAAREIESKCRVENIDLGRLKQQIERIGYPILGVVQQIVELCADGLGEWCHWTEVAEVYEPFHEARGSSSTMPQKRNPISCLYIHSTAAVVRQHVAALLEAAVADHGRSVLARESGAGAR